LKRGRKERGRGRRFRAHLVSELLAEGGHVVPEEFPREKAFTETLGDKKRETVYPRRL